MFAHMARRSRGHAYTPNADAYVDAENARIIVRVDVAGADRESLKIAAEDRALFITGIRPLPQPMRSASCLLKEIEYGAFERKIHLPFAIDPEQAFAHYEDGMLTLELVAAGDDMPTPIRTEIQLVFRRTTR